MSIRSRLLRLRPSRAAALVIEVVCFAVLGGLLVTVGVDHSEGSRQLVATSRFSVWVAVFTAQVASWPILWRVGRDQFGDLRAYAGSRLVRDVGPVALIGLAILLLWAYAQVQDDRPDALLDAHGVRTGIATIGAAIAVTPCLVAIRRAHAALDRPVTDDDSALHAFARLNAVRAAFTRSLTALGVLVTEVTLAAGALRSAILQAAPEADFPPEYVLLYGAFFTALLAAAAAPTYGRLSRRSAAVVDRLLPVKPPTEAGWRDRLAERRDLTAYLHADTSASKTFQASVLVAGPLLTGLLSLLVPTKS